MRHGLRFRKFSRSPQHTRALLKNMARAIIRYERIVTTLPKAKEMRRVTDKIVTLGKRDNPRAKRHAWNWLQHEALMTKLYGPLRSRYANRAGGYTRVLRIPNRKGDNADMAILELVDNDFPPLRDPKIHASATSRPSLPTLAAASQHSHSVQTFVPPEGTPV